MWRWALLQVKNSKGSQGSPYLLFYYLRLDMWKWALSQVKNSKGSQGSLYFYILLPKIRYVEMDTLAGEEYSRLHVPECAGRFSEQATHVYIEQIYF